MLLHVVGAVFLVLYSIVHVSVHDNVSVCMCLYLCDDFPFSPINQAEPGNENQIHICLKPLLVSNYNILVRVDFTLF